MGTWIWIQPGGKKWKVISNYTKGTIKVFDENNNLILEKDGLSEEALKVVEQNFLDIAAHNLDEGSTVTRPAKSYKKDLHEIDPMYS